MNMIGGKLWYTVNGISFVHPDTPLKLADYFQLSGVFVPGTIHVTPLVYSHFSAFGTSVIDATYHDYVHIVFENPLPFLQTWHSDGYNFFIVDMDFGVWDESMRVTYNMIDAVSCSTVQVYPYSWTSILMKLDSRGMWNLRSQNAENWYLVQELYIRVKGVGEEDPTKISPRDEYLIPSNVLRCRRAAALSS